METNPQKEPFVLAIAENKGGVGKTTSTLNLAAAASAPRPHGRQNKRVCVLDFDGQANASQCLGTRISLFADEQLSFGTTDELFDPLEEPTPISEMLLECNRPFFDGRLHYLPATPQFSDTAEEVDVRLKMESAAGKGTSYDRALYEAKKTKFIRNIRQRIKSELAGHFDYVLIDCPPALRLPTITALACADAVLIPIKVGGRELDGLEPLELTIAVVWKEYNPDLKIAGILINDVDQRTILTRETRDILLERYHGLDVVLRNEIPHSVRVSEASMNDRTVFEHDVPGADRIQEAYRKVIVELASRMQGLSTKPMLSGEWFYENYFGRQEVANE